MAKTSRAHGEKHFSQRIGWLRAAVLGANDGIVSTASLIMGIAAANADTKAILLASVAGLVAGAMSMAAGEYVSVSSQADTEQADLRREAQELADDPQAEQRELTVIYMQRGLDRELATQVSKALMAHDALQAHARDELGLTNIQIMIPFVRTVSEAKRVIELLAQNGLKRGENGLKIIMMCELPTNALLAEQFLEHFDGFSIGSNDLTQLTLGLDRDSGIVSHLFDERDAAVKALLSMAIHACRKAGKYVGICGQGPSDHPDLAKWLMEQGIESVSLNPDSVLDTWFFLAEEQIKKA